MKNFILVMMSLFIFSCSSSMEEKDITGTYIYKKQFKDAEGELKGLEKLDDGSFNIDSIFRIYSTDIIFEKMDLTMRISEDTLYLQNNVDGIISAMPYKLVSDSELIYTTNDGNNRSAKIEGEELTHNNDLAGSKDIVFMRKPLEE